MKDYNLFKALQKEVELGTVSVSKNGNLCLFKYTPECQYENKWNATNRLARGLIMRMDGEIVARPFPKFFNIGEMVETQIENLPWHEGFEITEKQDGSCGIGFLVENDNPESCYPYARWCLATTGAFESDQAIAGTTILHSGCYDLSHLPSNCTPIFEIIYPENRIVVNYGLETFLCLLTIFEKNGEEWHSNRVDQIAQKCGFRRPKKFFLTKDALLNYEYPSNFEGFVIRFDSGYRVKLKSPLYVKIHRLLEYMNPKRVIELIRGHEYGATLRELPADLAKDMDDIASHVRSLHAILRIQAEDLAAQVPLGDRKTKAFWIQKNVPNELTGIVFGMIDSKDMNDKIWKIVASKIKED